MNMQKIMPILFIAIGVYVSLGIWFPRMRSKWKGTQATCGALGCAGFALFFISLGATFFAVDSVPERDRIWFAVPIMMGWILGALGYAFDTRAHVRGSTATFSVTPQPQSSLRGQGRGWLLVGFGVFFLIVVLCAFVFHL
ncbi:MAG TPA: hypothetical protein VK815_16555 [Candidatus Acidoferrales bacterium]|jgi:hypothetical protein|nr:hypothetical protein [Candidatus Acidoferrales bacterium]